MTVTRSYLRNALQEVGFTYREARSLVSALFEILSTELKKGNPLELPFGTLTVREPEPKRAYRLGRIVRINAKRKIQFKKRD